MARSYVFSYIMTATVDVRSIWWTRMGREQGMYGKFKTWGHERRGQSVASMDEYRNAGRKSTTTSPRNAYNAYVWGKCREVQR